MAHHSGGYGIYSCLTINLAYYYAHITPFTCDIRL